MSVICTCPMRIQTIPKSSGAPFGNSRNSVKSDTLGRGPFTPSRWVAFVCLSTNCCLSWSVLCSFKYGIFNLISLRTYMIKWYLFTWLLANWFTYIVLASLWVLCAEMHNWYAAIDIHEQWLFSNFGDINCTHMILGKTCA